MGNKRIPGNKPVIKDNLKTSDRITLIYNNNEVEMSLADFTTFLNSNLSLGETLALNDLSDAAISSPSSGEVLTYNGSSWANAAGGTSLSVASITLSSAEIQAGNTLQKEIVAAQGANMVIEPISATVKYNYGTAAFDVGTDLQIVQNGNIIFNFAGLLATTADSITVGAKSTNIGNAAANTNLTTRMDADSTAGDSDAVVYVTYRVIDVS